MLLRQLLSDITGGLGPVWRKTDFKVQVDGQKLAEANC